MGWKDQSSALPAWQQGSSEANDNQPQAQAAAAPAAPNYWALAGSNLLYGLTSGIDTLARMGASLQGVDPYPDAPGAKPEESLMAGHPPAPSLQSMLPSGIQPSAPGIAPTTQGQRLVAAGLQGIGSAIPAALAGQPEAAIPTLLAGGGGGLGGEVAHELYPDSKVAPFIGGLVGGLTPGIAASGFVRAGNALRGDLTPTGEAFATAGIPRRSVGLTSDSRLSQHMFQPLADIPQAELDLQQSLGQTAASLGNSTTLEEAGRYAQGAARNWVENVMPKKEALAWAPVDAKIPAGTITPLNSFEGVLRSLRGDAGILQPLRDALTSSLPKRLQGLLDDVNANAPTAPVWSEVRSLRSAIGNAMANPSIVKDIDQQSLKALYAGVTQDLSAVAKNQGAANEFASANAESTRLHSFNDNVVSKIISTGNPAQESILPEAVGKAFLSPSALKAGGSDLEALNTELPDVTRQLAAAKVRQMAGMDDPKTIPDVSAKSFTKAWEAMSPEAKNALVLDLPTRARLDSAYTVGQRILAKPLKPRIPEKLAGAILGTEVGPMVSHYLFGTPENSLVPQGFGAMVGYMAPAARDMTMNSLANNRLLAAYATGRGPQMLFPGQLPVISALAGGGTNVISGQGGQ